MVFNNINGYKPATGEFKIHNPETDYYDKPGYEIHTNLDGYVFKITDLGNGNERVNYRFEYDKGDLKIDEKKKREYFVAKMTSGVIYKKDEAIPKMREEAAKVFGTAERQF